MTMEEPHRLKPVIWIGSSRKDLRSFPDEVRDFVGYALYEAQMGSKNRTAKPLLGFRSAGVVEIIKDCQTDTYRAVYTVKFGGIIYVLHAFQKKSKHGIATAKPDIALIKARLKLAEEDYKFRLAEDRKNESKGEAAKRKGDFKE